VEFWGLQKVALAVGHHQHIDTGGGIGVDYTASFFVGFAGVYPLSIFEDFPLTYTPGDRIFAFIDFAH